MRESIWKVLVLFCMAVLHLQCALGQMPSCLPTQVDNFLILNTSTETVDITCTVPASDLLNQSDFLWQWFRLGPDRIPRSEITEGVTQERNLSVYTHPVQCTSSGFYQAFYRSIDGDFCQFSCYFVISEVRETRLDVLREEFASYPNGTTVLSNPNDDASVISGNEGATLPVGLCAGMNLIFILPTTCTVLVSRVQWFRNGVQFEPDNQRQDYILSAIGELVIRNLTESTMGYYVCQMTVDGLDSFQVVQANIIIASPTTSPPSPSPTSVSTVTPPMTTLAAPESLFGELEVWQFGLIIGVASLVIIAILLSGVVWMAGLTIRRRRETRRRRSRGRSHATTNSSNQVAYKKNVAPATRNQPKSMLEEIQMMETIEEEDTDFGMSSSPVEVLFSCILFEELLHKGTFKVVHHGVVDQPDQGMLGVPVAVKRLKDEKSELGYEELMNEAMFLRTFQEKIGSHPSIVSLLGLTTQGGPTCLLLDFVPNGTLDNFLTALKLGPIPEWYMKFVRDTLRGAYHKHVSGDLMNIVMQVAEGMKFLTDNGFIHRDLSTRNILMGERLNIKIANPGMQHEGYYYVVSEREHFLQDMAPECLWEKRYSVCSDVWSFGILVYKTVTLNTTPFPDVEVDELHGRMVGGERPQLLASFSNEMYFLLQRCWQFVATERPSFSTIGSDLMHMAVKPTRHIILKSTKDPAKPGYVSENGQVFLRALPPHALEDDEPPQKKTRRSSGTLRSLISSIDDTVYTRETAETVLDLTPSETENEFYNNYERYLKGDLPLLNVAKRRSYEETDTSGNDANTREKIRPRSSRKSSKSTARDGRGENADEASTGKASGTSSSKRKKKRSMGSVNREKAHKASPGLAKRVFLPQTAPGGGVAPHEDSGDVSSIGAPSTEEEENKGGRATSDLSGSEGSQVDLVRL